MLNVSGYQISEKIYQGSKSVVYRGYREKDQKPVMIKVPTEEYPSSRDIKKLKHEYEIIRHLNINGVVQAQDIQKYKNKYILILEDFGGHSLKEHSSPNKVTILFFLKLAIQLAAILGDIHSKNIIHKDLKPQNIILNEKTEEVKIIDFSISSLIEKEKQDINNPELPEGTLAYISPEQTGRMNRSVDYRTDYYSLGVTFYELLTDRLPFDSQEPMELIHSHIARNPTPPNEINDEIPKPIADIIMKLLAKTVEERYQSAYGLKSDLEKCLQLLNEHGHIKDFKIAEKDVSNRFQIPEKLYGREKEIKMLLAAYDSVKTGKSKIFFCPGDSGVGKSALINEIILPVTTQKGYFISGVFDSLNRNIPYSAIIGAFQELIKELLTESEDKLKYWQENILKHIGSIGQVIIDVIPELELIIGKQPAIQKLPPTEAQNRFNLLFQAFIKVFAKKNHPIVLFIDDLQWADNASLHLLEVFCNDPELHHFLFLGAYRHQEVKPTHPLTMVLEKLKKEEIVWQQLHINPLDVQEVNQLLSETLSSHLEKTRDLAVLVHSKTNGNPFFIKEYLKELHSKNMIRFQETWIWDISKIKQTTITDNVVELMTEKIMKFQVDTLATLKTAACLGFSFKLDTLASILKKDSDLILEDLKLPFNHGIIIKSGNEAKFAHDRVREAVYSVMNLKEREELHYKIGQSFLIDLNKEKIEDNIFIVVNQLNLSTNLIVKEDEKKKLAEMNLFAGQKAKASAAYQAALNFFKAGWNLIQEESWTKDYRLTYSLYMERAEAEYLNTNFEEAERVFDIILNKAKTPVEKTTIYEIRISLYTEQGNLTQALKIGLDSLKTLGISLPKKPSKPQLITEILKVKLLIRKKQISNLIHLPDMTDQNKIAAMRLLMQTIAPAYMGLPDLFPFLVLNMVKLSLKYGNTPISAYAYSMYGLILAGGLMEFDNAYDFGVLSQNLINKYNDRFFKTKIFFNLAVFTNHTKKDFQSGLPYLLEGIETGLESGDLAHTSYCLNHYHIQSLLIGRNLEELENSFNSYLDLMEKTKQENAVHWFYMFKQLILCLQGKAENKLKIIGSIFDEDSMLANWIQSKNTHNLCVLYIIKSILYYLYEDLHKALHYAIEAENLIESVFGMMFVQVHNFYHSLILTAVYPEASNSARKKYIQQINKNQKKMKKWAESSPDNYMAKYLLVKAETSRILNKNMEQSLNFYNTAIKKACDSDNLMQEAIANELTAKFYLKLEMENVAKTFLIDARHNYELWGAKPKILDLEDKYPNLLSKIAKKHSIKTDTTIVSTSSSALESLDLESVLKVSQNISSEIDLHNLINKLIQIVLENSGAQKAFLLLQKQQKLVIEAEGAIDKKRPVILQSIAVDEAHNNGISMANSVINFVTRSKEAVVIDDALDDRRFANDQHIKQNQPKSILCTPIIYQSRLTGILYLENSLTKGAFTPDRLELLNLLSSQIAISIENANLYTNLEDKVLERTKELKEAHEKIIKLEKETTERIMAGGFAHEMRNALTGAQKLVAKALGRDIGNNGQSLCLENSQILKEIFLLSKNNMSAEVLKQLAQHINNINNNEATVDEILNRLQTRTNRALNITDQIMDYSKAGQSVAGTNPVSLSKLIQTIVREEEQEELSDYDIQVKLELDSKKELPGDEGHFYSIIKNLLLNSRDAVIPVSDEKRKQILIKLFDDDDSQTIIFQDQGIGIKPEFQNCIFEPFFSTKSVKGTGLGLGMVSKYISLYHGSIEFETKAGEGSRFIVKFPFV